jgi:threonine/homoserine/homoserine lactone efflux protein
MDESDVSFKKGIPFYIAGIAIITTGFLFYPVPSWFSLIAFIAAGIIFYLGWLIHMGKDTKEFDNGSGGGKRIFIDRLT